MFGKIFGKREAPAPQPTGTLPVSTFENNFPKDNDGVRRIFSNETWNGPHGDFLKSIGASPDDPSNIVTTNVELQNTHSRLKNESKIFVENVNLQLPSNVKVAAWCMIPETTWHMEFGEFLMRNFKWFAFSPLNTMLLPVDEFSSRVLTLPLRMNEPPKEYVAGIMQGLISIATKLNVARANTDEALKRGDTDAPSRFKETIRLLESEIFAMANTFPAMLYGRPAYDRHMLLFGRILNWPHAEQMLK